MPTDKKPAGWNKFAALAKRIVAVPKDKVDAAIARELKANKRRSPQKK